MLRVGFGKEAPLTLPLCRCLGPVFAPTLAFGGAIVIKVCVCRLLLLNVACVVCGPLLLLLLSTEQNKYQEMSSFCKAELSIERTCQRKLN